MAFTTSRAGGRWEYTCDCGLPKIQVQNKGGGGGGGWGWGSSWAWLAFTGGLYLIFQLVD